MKNLKIAFLSVVMTAVVGAQSFGSGLLENISDIDDKTKVFIKHRNSGLVLDPADMIEYEFKRIVELREIQQIHNATVFGSASRYSSVQAALVCAIQRIDQSISLNVLIESMIEGENNIIIQKEQEIADGAGRPLTAEEIATLERTTRLKAENETYEADLLWVEIPEIRARGVDAFNAGDTMSATSLKTQRNIVEAYLRASERLIEFLDNRERIHNYALMSDKALKILNIFKKGFANYTAADSAEVLDEKIQILKTRIERASSIFLAAMEDIEREIERSQIQMPTCDKVRETLEVLGFNVRAEESYEKLLEKIVRSDGIEFYAIDTDIRKTLAENHPDRFMMASVAHQQRAEIRTKKMITAYEKIKQWRILLDTREGMLYLLK